jgi:hypothetical protein
MSSSQDDRALGDDCLQSDALREGRLGVVLHDHSPFWSETEAWPLVAVKSTVWEPTNVAHGGLPDGRPSEQGCDKLISATEGNEAVCGSFLCLEELAMPDPSPQCGPDADEDLPEEVDAIEWGIPPVRAVRLWRKLSVVDLSKRRPSGEFTGYTSQKG